jgi:methionyl-tRNA formyltransferase
VKKSGESGNAPGTIVDISNDGITVETGNNTFIRIKELQPSGKTKMSVEDFLRGAGSKLTTGVKLGE